VARLSAGTLRPSCRCLSSPSSALGAPDLTLLGDLADQAVHMILFPAGRPFLPSLSARPSIYASVVAPTTSRTLSMPRDICCAEACKRFFVKQQNSLSRLHSQKALRSVVVARNSCLSGNHAWLTFFA
jgi:hypothetical protein